MGWTMCLATERDPERVTWLDKPCSYALFGAGFLRAWLTDEEAAPLDTGGTLGPDPVA